MTGAARHRWQDIRDRIHARILDRTWRPGDKLPRDEDIARDMGCSRSTVQRAMQDLADAGLVERRRKGGTQLRADPVARATLDIPIIRHEVEARGAAYGYQLVARRIEETPPRIAAALALPGPRDLLRVEALHLADQRPYMFEDRWICPETVPEILSIDLSEISANEWLVMNKPFTGYDLRLFAVEADARTALQLDTAAGTALLVMERSTWINGAPITNVRVVTAPGYQVQTRA